MPSQYDKEAADRLAEAIAADPHIYELGDFIADLIGVRTEFERAECRSHVLVDTLGRGLGSRNAAAEHLTVPGKWQRILQISAELDGGAPLPWSPPTENRVRKWRERFLPRGRRPDHRVVPPTLRQIQAKVMELGVRRAVELGQFPDGVEPDFARPDWRHMVIGDGTWVKKYSRAEILEDPEHGEVRAHSRAKGAPRRQQAIQAVKKDDTWHVGVLHTVLITESHAGWVFLGGDQTFGGESLSSLELVEQVAGILGDRLHTLCYDRGYTGWPVDWLMSRFGIPVVSVINPALGEEKDKELQQHTLDAQKALGVLLPGRDTRRRQLTAIRAQRSLQKAANVEQMIQHRAQGLPAGIGLPLGHCYYLTSGENVEKVVSEHHHLATHEHPRTDGSACAHHMYVDDGPLWEAVLDGTEWVKAQRPSQSTARRVLDPETGAYTRVLDYQLTCPETGHVLHERAVWRPELVRGKPSKHRTRSSADKALEALHPLPRCDAGFGSVYGRRNEVESWFSWYKSKLRRGDSSASLSLDHQLLDLLLAGMVTNTRALRRGRLAGLVTTAAAS